MDIIEKHGTGWWFVCVEGQNGFAPSSYLEPMSGGGDEECSVETFEKGKGTSFLSSPPLHSPPSPASFALSSGPSSLRSAPS